MSFDPNLFMQQTIEQPLETERTLVPPAEYQMMVDDFESSAIEEISFEYKKGAQAGQPGTMHVFNCPCVIQSDTLKAELGVEKVIVYKRINLDIGPDGNLEWGKNKNIDLGQLRAAVNQNGSGPWSIGMLRGAGPFMGRVDKKTGKRKDGSDFESREVGRVAPLRS